MNDTYDRYFFTIVSIYVHRTEKWCLMIVYWIPCFSFFWYSSEFSISSAFCILSLVVFITWKYSFISQRSRAISALSCVLIRGSDFCYCSSLNFTPSFSPISFKVASISSSTTNFSSNDSNFLYLFFNSFRCPSINCMVNLITAPLATRLRW